MRWLLDVCPNNLGWQAWLILCVVVVALWALAITAATALFHASSRPGEAWEQPARSGYTGRTD